MDFLNSSYEDSRSKECLEKDKMIGRAIFKGGEMLCPVSTLTAVAIGEQPELRAYKLGKQKCSYNQVELLINDISTGKNCGELKVSEAIETCVGAEVDDRLRESCLKFNVRFVNNNRMHLYIYVVYATPFHGTRSDKQSVMYHWIPVTRSKCRKGCKGPVIRGLQRFGRMPRRSAATLDGEDSWKEPRHLYVAIDEASTHVCPRHETSKFRLLVAAYDDNYQLLGTTVSGTIRVLANNDAPLGAASFKLHCNIKGGWGTHSRSWQYDNVIDTNRSIDKIASARIPLQDIQQIGSSQSCNSSTTEHAQKQTDVGSTLTPTRYQDQNETPNIVEGLSKDKVSCSAISDVELKVMYKEHSLTDLCQRLLEACISKSECHLQPALTLRGLASCLGARRRRIMEIMQVLETVQVIRHQGKETYTWLGALNISRALRSLKLHSEESRRLKETNQCSTSPGTEFRSPIRDLSRRFLELFLNSQKSRVVPWEHIVKCMAEENTQDPETLRAKLRRLSEIARIYMALHLIKKVPNHKLPAEVAFDWLGSKGVSEHLSSIIRPGLVTGEANRKCLKVHRRKIRTNVPQDAYSEGVAKVENGFNLLLHGSPELERLQNKAMSPTTASSEGETYETQRQRKHQLEPSESRDKEGNDAIQSDKTAIISGNKGVNSIDQFSKPSQVNSVLSPGIFWKTCEAALGICSPFSRKSHSSSDNAQVHVSSQLQASTTRQMAESPGWQNRTLLCSGMSHAKFDCEEASLHNLASSSDKTVEESTFEEKVHEVGQVQLRNATSEDEISKEFGHERRIAVIVESPIEYQTTSHCDSRYQGTYRSISTVHYKSPESRIRKELRETEKEGRFQISDESNNQQMEHMAAHEDYRFPSNKRKFVADDLGNLREFDQILMYSKRSRNAAAFEELLVSNDGDNRQFPEFDPLRYLQRIFTRDQLMQLQLHIPAFLFHYVQLSRVLYHNICARAEEQGIIRPVAKHGRILTLDIGPACAVVGKSGPSNKTSPNSPHSLRN